MSEPFRDQPTRSAGGLLEGSPDEYLRQVTAVLGRGVEVGRRFAAFGCLHGGVLDRRSLAEGLLDGGGPQRGGAHVDEGDAGVAVLDGGDADDGPVEGPAVELLVRPAGSR